MAKEVETVKAVYSGTNTIQHAHGTLKPNQGLVELEKGNFEHLKKLFPNTLKSMEESNEEYRQTGVNQVGAPEAPKAESVAEEGADEGQEEEQVQETKKAGRPRKQ